MTTRYLICGGRFFTDAALMDKALAALILGPLDAVIIHGAAKGADSLADQWARRVGVKDIIACPADWKAHPQRGGVIRNTFMLHVHKPDVVIAFEGKNGTADMVKKARRAGVVTIEVTGGPDDWTGKGTP